MGGWLRYLALNAQVRAGFSTFALVWAAVAAFAAGLAVILLVIAAFFWLTDRYDPIKAGLILGGMFAIIALLAAGACVITRARNIARARRALAQRKSENAGWLDPKLVAAGLQIGKDIGWRRVGSLAMVALVAAGLAYEWVGRKPSPPKEDPPEA
jgi:hypothetical protein